MEKRNCDKNQNVAEIYHPEKETSSISLKKKIWKWDQPWCKEWFRSVISKWGCGLSWMVDVLNYWFVCYLHHKQALLCWYGWYGAIIDPIWQGTDEAANATFMHIIWKGFNALNFSCRAYSTHDHPLPHPVHCFENHLILTAKCKKA